MGTGALIALGNIPVPLTEGGTGSMSSSYEQPAELPDKLESGTLNVPGIIGMSAGIDFVKSKTVPAIYKHELGIISYIYDRLSATPGVVLYTEKTCPRQKCSDAVIQCKGTWQRGDRFKAFQIRNSGQGGASLCSHGAQKARNGRYRDCKDMQFGVQHRL